MKIPAEEPPKPPAPDFTLADLAGAYRKKGTTRKYIKRDTWLPNPKQKVDETFEMDETSQLAELSRLDELDNVDEGDVFGGEITRDYQGVLPLNGEPRTEEKYPLKQGALVETRGYVLF
jgi:hypothetical protein